MKHLLLFTCCTIFLHTATCYRNEFDGNPRNNRFLPQVLGNEEEQPYSRQPRQNRFSSPDGANNLNQLFGFGNPRPNTGGFNWGGNQNNINEPRPSRQNDFVFEDNDFVLPNVPSSTRRPTRRPQNPTVAVPGMATTRSPCEDNCPATSQFDPVCGDNNVTYTNINWLRCAQRCGRNVTVKYVGSCPRVP